MQNRKQNELELRLEIQSLRHTQGILKVLDLLAFEKYVALHQWQKATGEDLIRCQERYNHLETLIDKIANPPKTF